MPSYSGINIGLVSQFGILTVPEFIPPESTPSKQGKQPQLLDSTESVVTVYIPTYPSSIFWFMYEVADPDPGSMFYFKLFINTRHVVSWGCCKRDGWKGKTMFALSEDKRTEGKKVRHALAFAPDGYDASNDVFSIKVYRARGRRRIQYDKNSFIVTDVANRDAPKSRKDGAIRLLYGGRLRRRQPLNHYQYALIDPVDKPFITFRYLPRSYDELEGMGLTLAEFYWNCDQEDWADDQEPLPRSPCHSSIKESPERASPVRPHFREIDGRKVNRRASLLEILHNTPSAPPLCPPSPVQSSPFRIPDMKPPESTAIKPPSPVKKAPSSIPRPQSSLYNLRNNTRSTEYLPSDPSPRTERNLTPSPAGLRSKLAQPTTPTRVSKNVNFSRPPPSVSPTMSITATTTSPSSLPVPVKRTGSMIPTLNLDKPLPTITNPVFNKPDLRPAGAPPVKISQPKKYQGKPSSSSTIPPIGAFHHQADTSSISKAYTKLQASAGPTEKTQPLRVACTKYSKERQSSPISSVSSLGPRTPPHVRHQPQKRSKLSSEISGEKREHPKKCEQGGTNVDGSPEWGDSPVIKLPPPGPRPSLPPESNGSPLARKTQRNTVRAVRSESPQLTRRALNEESRPAKAASQVPTGVCVFTMPSAMKSPKRDSGTINGKMSFKNLRAAFEKK